MHEITIAQSRYLTQDAVAAAILAVARSVAAGSGPVTVEFPIVPRSSPDGWDATTYIRVAITATSTVSATPSAALEFRPDAGQTLRILAAPEHHTAPSSGEHLDYLGYEAR
ncbi:hypothetical protein HQQ81_04455 [Microbacteriaceae bacterium VKM Ac-2854]|nr:hypothetical protein [Microbacteriaceae bacterium VKM Ac-2854]